MGRCPHCFAGFPAEMCVDGDFLCPVCKDGTMVDTDDCNVAFSVNSEEKLATLAREEVGAADENLTTLAWPTFDAATKAKLARTLALLRRAIVASAPEDREVAERVLGQLRGVVDAASVVREFDQLVRVAFLIIGNDRGAGRTIVPRIQDAPYVWRKLVLAAQVAWRLDAHEALALFELAQADDLSRRKRPTNASVGPDARALLLRLGFAAVDAARGQTATPGVPAPRLLRVLSLGWLTARLVKHGLNWRTMHAGAFDPSEDEVSTGEYLRIVDVFADGRLVASFILALGPHPTGFGRGSALGDIEVLSSLLRALFAAEVPAHLPRLRIDLDALLDDAIGDCVIDGPLSALAI